MAEQIEVYESQHTAQQIEDAMGAVLSIGENGNWWIGDNDTGVFAGGVKVTGAKPGQTIVVNAVDSEGVPTSWRPANTHDTWDVHYKEIMAGALTNGFSITEVGGKPLKLKELYVMAKLQNGAATAQWMGCTIKGLQKNSTTLVDAVGSSGNFVIVNPNAYVYCIYHAKLLPDNGRMACNVTLFTAGPLEGSTTNKFITNDSWLNHWLDYYAYDCFSGVACPCNLGPGPSETCGTEIEFWGRSV